MCLKTLLYQKTIDTGLDMCIYRVMSTGTNLPIEKRDQETQFILSMFEHNDVRQAGKAAGYSDSVINSGYLYTKWKDPRFKDKVLGIAIAYDVQDFIDQLYIERTAYQQARIDVEQNPQNAEKHLKTLEATGKIKRESIGLNVPQQGKGLTINVNTMNVIQGQLKQACQDTIDVTPENSDDTQA